MQPKTIGSPTPYSPAISSPPPYAANGPGGVTSAGESENERSLLREIDFLSNKLINNPNISPTRDQLKDQIKEIKRNLETHDDAVSEKAVLDLVACAKNPRISDPKAQSEVIKICDFALKKLLSKKDPSGNFNTHIVSPGPRPPDFHKIQREFESIELAPGGENSHSHFTSIRALAGKVFGDNQSKSTKTIQKASSRIEEELRKKLEERLAQYRR